MATIAVYTNFGGHIVKENRSGTKRGYVPDPLGSTVALVDSLNATQLRCIRQLIQYHAIAYENKQSFETGYSKRIWEQCWKSIHVE